MEKRWFVANDHGDVAGHDLSETKAKLLAEELNDKKSYFIKCGKYYVSKEETASEDIEKAKEFYSEEEARSEIKLLALKYDVLDFDIAFMIKDVTWEAMTA